MIRCLSVAGGGAPGPVQVALGDVSVVGSSVRIGYRPPEVFRISGALLQQDGQAVEPVLSADLGGTVFIMGSNFCPDSDQASYNLGPAVTWDSGRGFPYLYGLYKGQFRQIRRSTVASGSSPFRQETVEVQFPGGSGVSLGLEVCCHGQCWR